jgi:hypothetical protein
MAKVRFYRGGGASSLPQAPQDGAIFIVERGDSGLGDIYVDVSNAKRLHIVPDSELITYNSSMSGIVSTLGQPYIFQETNKIGIAVGDGQAFIGDLPVYNYTTVTTAIKNKVNAYLGTEYSNLSSNQKQLDGLTLPSSQAEIGETLVLSREL